MGFFEKLGQGLARTRDAIFGTMGDELAQAERITDDTYDELVEQLVLADTGLDVAEDLVAKLKERVKAEHLKTGGEALAALKAILVDTLSAEGPFEPQGKPAVILVIGVNGVGKTTSIGKLANLYRAQGKKVLLAAGDTFRAAAAEQLGVWAERAGVPLVRHEEGSDPAAVIFDAVQAARARGIHIVLADTAGRLPTQMHLMDEIAKIRRVIAKAEATAPHEVLLVLDGTIGQNAIAQVKAFDKAINVSGLVITKLDGSAKGGVLAAIACQCPKPVRYIGVGEQVEDLQPFSARAFAEALLG